MSYLPLPRDAAHPVDAEGWVTNRVKLPNFALVLNKLQPWQRSQDTWALLGDEAGGRGEWLRRLSEKAADGKAFDQKLLAENLARWRAMVKAYGVSTILKATTRQRLIVGLGVESTLETSITLHRIYGFPIIPGSALKGLCRAVCLVSLASEFGLEPVPAGKLVEAMQNESKKLPPGLHTLAELMQGAEPERQRALETLQKEGANRLATMSLTDIDEKNESVRRFRSMFGTMEDAGDLMFFDGVPEPTERLLEADVLTPHFSDYYMDQTNKTPPNDDLQPVPTVFLVVPKGATFDFAVGVRQAKHGDPYAIRSADVARDWLAFALREVGIGGKTNAGYGRFDPVERVSTS